MFKHLKVFLSSTLHSAMIGDSDLDQNPNDYHLEITKWAERYGTTLYEFQANKLSRRSITSTILRDESKLDQSQRDYGTLSEFISHSPPALIVIYNFTALDAETARFLSKITADLRINKSSWKILYLGRSESQNSSLLKLLALDTRYPTHREHQEQSEPSSKYGKPVSMILGLAAASLMVWFMVSDNMPIQKAGDDSIKELPINKAEFRQDSTGKKIVRHADEMREWENHISEFEMMMSKYSDTIGGEVKQEIAAPKKTKLSKAMVASRSRPQAVMSPEMQNAASGGNLQDLINAVNTGTDINSVSQSKLESALIIAATGGHKSLVSWLIDNGANTNQTDVNKRSSLFYAAVNGHQEISKLLLKKGANPNSVTKHGKTPLMAAVHNNHIELSKLLISANTDINLRDHSGWSALFYASWNNNKTIGDLLLKSGAKPLLKDNEGYTAKDIAMAKGSTLVAELFNL